MNLPLLKNASDLLGKRVLLRLDLNLPIVDGQVRDDFRLRRSLPTLEFLKAHGARTIILSHTDSKETDSLLPVAKLLLQKFRDLQFAPSIEELPKRLTALAPGGFLFLENLRRNPGEEENDLQFAKRLSSFGDIYVNDAFSVSHRAHASIVGVPKFLRSFAGLLFAEEVSHLSKAFNPPKPFLFLLAGAKFETKFPLVQKFLKSADNVFIGGALANDLLKTKGYEIGLSKHSEKDFGFEGILKNQKLIIPTDVVTENDGKQQTKKASEVSPSDTIFDAGSETVALISEKLKTAKFVLWNGTLGAYEKGFTEGTENLARAIAQSKVESIVGGGDTVASLGKLGLLEKFSFVSTGGGAMLRFLANETLPGIVSLTGSLGNSNRAIKNAL